MDSEEFITIWDSVDVLLDFTIKVLAVVALIQYIMA
jgi:hypothetical protein